MAVSDAAMLKIVGRARRVNWDVEDGNGSKAPWAYRITRPDGKRVQIHRTPSDTNWENSVLRQLNQGGLLEAAEREWAVNRDRERRGKIEADREKAETAAAKAAAQSAAVVKAAGPYAVVEAEAKWLLTPSSVPETRTVIITPAIARRLLDTINTYNRPKRDSRTDEFVAIIEDGEWGVTHQGGAIDRNGVLQDGQHRLAAIDRTGKPQAMQMSVGMDPKNFTKVDIPLVRRARDAAYMRGERNVLTLTAAARLIIMFDRLGPNLHTKGGRTKVSIDAVDRATQEWGDDLRNAVSRATRIRKEIKIPATSLATAFYLIGRKLPVDDPRLDRFFTELETGSGIEKPDAVWLLRRHFIREDMGTGRPGAYSALAYLIKAWNARAADRRITQLVWRSNEPFPATILLPPPITQEDAA